MLCPLASVIHDKYIYISRVIPALPLHSLCSAAPDPNTSYPLCHFHFRALLAKLTQSCVTENKRKLHVRPCRGMSVSFIAGHRKSRRHDGPSTLRTAFPVTRRHAPQDLNLKQYRCDNLRSHIYMVDYCVIMLQLPRLWGNCLQLLHLHQQEEENMSEQRGNIYV